MNSTADFPFLMLNNRSSYKTNCGRLALYVAYNKRNTIIYYGSLMIRWYKNYF